MKMAWYFVQTLMGCIGSVGFAVLFNIRGRKLLLAAGGGALAWAVYLACTCNGLDIFAGLFFATLAAALASELLARAVKAPVIMLLVPMLIPLIPVHTCVLFRLLPRDPPLTFCFFFFNDTATTEIYTLSLHDALPISASFMALP